MSQADSEKRVDGLIKDPNRTKPEFLTEPTMDKMISVVMRLAMEISVLRDQLSMQQTLLKKHNILSANEIENFEPDDAEKSLRDKANFALIEAIVNDLK